MSNSEENVVDFNMIYRDTETNMKIYYEKIRKNFGFEMIYKPNDNKKEKIEKLKKYKEEYNYFLDSDKDYSGDFLRLFGRYFVNRNKNKCKIIYKNKKYELKEYFEEIDDSHKDKSIIKLKLYGIDNISDMGKMFGGCFLLSSISQYPKGNVQQFNNNSSDNFSESNSYISLQEEIKSKNENTNDLSNSVLNERFYKGYFESSLSNIEDKNNTYSFENNDSNSKNLEINSFKCYNIANMEKMFQGCISLVSIPDISSWDISNARYINSIFSLCESLSNIPDISKWDTSNVINMRAMFNKCELLISLPDLSKWNTSKVITFEGMFQDCCKLTSLPDISKWDTSNVINMGNIFNNCGLLISLPDLSKWNVSKVISLEGMFQDCRN